VRNPFLIIRLVAVLALLGSAGAAHAKNIQTAIFAGGCFWCVEKDFDHVKGVVKTTSGYTGGQTNNPTYKQVTKGGTGHYEAVQIQFDADIVTYEQLINSYWRSVDAVDAGGQFCDRGDSYRTAVFATTPQQAVTAQASKASAEQVLGQSIVTPILMAGPFFEAEKYHQDYYQKSPLKYKFYRSRCGRDARVKQLWGQSFSGS